jgi:hypothetical protein
MVTFFWELAIIPHSFHCCNYVSSYTLDLHLVLTWNLCMLCFSAVTTQFCMPSYAYACLPIVCFPCCHLTVFSYCRILTKPRIFFLGMASYQGKLFVLLLFLYLLCGLSWPWYCRILFCVFILVVLTFSFHADGATRHFEFSATEGKNLSLSIFFRFFVFLAILRRFISTDRELQDFAAFNACMHFCCFVSFVFLLVDLFVDNLFYCFVLPCTCLGVLVGKLVCLRCCFVAFLLIACHANRTSLAM